MRGALTVAEYERVARAARTYREALVVALCGRVGLRSGELADVKPAHLTERSFDGRTHAFLRVPNDGRRAYVPDDVAREFERYVNANNVGEDECVFDVTPRRLQMLVSEVATRASDGDDRLADAAARDLRGGFARRHLADGVDPRVVRATGGWASLDSLEPYLEHPTDREIAAAMTDDGDETADDAVAFAGASRRLGAALADVSTRDAVDRAACEALAPSLPAVWTCDEHGDLRERAGVDAETARATLRESVQETGLLGRHGVDEQGAFAQRALDAERWGRDAVVAVSSIRSNGTTHGLLCAVTETTETEGLRGFLVDAGRRIGWTTAAVERKRLLVADTGVELAFDITAGSFFVAASRELDCAFDLDGLVPVEDGDLLCFVTTSGASVEDILAHAGEDDRVRDVRLIRDHGDRAHLECVVSADTPTGVVVDRGGAVESLAVADGDADLTAVFPKAVDVRGVVEAVTDRFSGVELHSKRETERRPQTTDLRQTLQEDLTEKQRATLRAAYFGGYFEWPRGSTAEELADAMDVSAPTLHNHLRKAQQKLLTAAFADDA